MSLDANQVHMLIERLRVWHPDGDGFDTSMSRRTTVSVRLSECGLPSLMTCRNRR